MPYSVGPEHKGIRHSRTKTQVVASARIIKGHEAAAERQGLDFEYGKRGEGSAGSALTLKGLEDAAERQGFVFETGKRGRGGPGSVISAAAKRQVKPTASHNIFCICDHCKQGHWLPASDKSHGTATELKLQVSYGTALHTPGCEAAATAIVVSITLRLIEEPPPRFAKLNQPYSLVNRHEDVERRLIPTKFELR